MAKDGTDGSFLFLENDLGEYLFQVMGRDYPTKDRGKLFLPGGRQNPGESPQETAAREAKQETGLIVDPKDIKWFGAAAQSPKGQAFLCYANVHRGSLRSEVDGEITGRMFLSVREIYENRGKIHRPALYMFIMLMRWKRGFEPTPCVGRISQAIVWPESPHNDEFVLPAKGSS